MSLHPPGPLLIPKAFLHTAQRVLCERSLYDFARFAFPILEPGVDFVDGWHIRALCEHLQAITEGALPRGDLLVCMPPGHMKSIIVSVIWPVWEWGPKRLPWLRIIHASHSPNNVTRDSMRRRELIDSPWYLSHWGNVFYWKADQKTKTRYENTNNGWMWGITTVGSGTGEHPDRLLIDDPHDAEKVLRQSDRERVTKIWWATKMASRGAGRGCRRVLVMQRHHVDDLAGYWLKHRRKQIIPIILPLRYEGPGRMDETPLGFTDPRTEVGDLLWPGLFPQWKIDDAFGNMTPNAELGQLQQRPPRHTAGTEWPADWFEDDRLFVPRMPKREDADICVLALDPSLGKNEAADYQAFALIMVRDGRAYAWVLTERMDSQSLCHKLVDLYERFSPHAVVVEGNGFQEVLAIPIQAEARRRGLALPLVLANHHGRDKRVRVSAALTYLLKRRELLIDIGSPGARIAQEQLQNFPGSHDDVPDAIAMGVTAVRNIIKQDSGDADETETEPYYG